MSRYLLVVLILSGCDFISPKDDFKPVEVTYRIDGSERDASINFMRGDSTIYPSRAPNLNLSKIPFSYSFTADHPQHLSISAHLQDSCYNVESCDVTVSVLIDGEIHRVWDASSVFSGESESLVLKVFTISAWRQDEGIGLEYGLVDESESQGELRYKDTEGWKSTILTGQHRTGSPKIIVQPGFMAGAELTISSKANFKENFETDLWISTQDSLGRTMDAVGLRYIGGRKNYGKTARVSLPIHGY